jgi:uncharacterized protein YndB with AHSA1/START domain
VSKSQWHRFYTATVAAPPKRLFDLLSDMPNYRNWLPESEQFGRTTEVDPYPVRLGSRYHDGRPDEPGKDWWGTVIGFQPPGSVDFHHSIAVRQLRATVDVHIHYSFEPADAGTQVNRWLVLDITMPLVLRPLRSAVISKFDKENVRTMSAVKQYAESEPGNIARNDGREASSAAGVDAEGAVGSS